MIDQKVANSTNTEFTRAAINATTIQSSTDTADGRLSHTNHRRYALSLYACAAAIRSSIHAEALVYVTCLEAQALPCPRAAESPAPGHHKDLPGSMHRATPHTAAR